MLGAGTVEYSAGPLQRLRLGNVMHISESGGLPCPFIITFPPKRGIQMTEEMRYLSRVKGRGTTTVQAHIREKQANDTVLAHGCSDST
jgi:hypothetical protein